MNAIMAEGNQFDLNQGEEDLPMSMDDILPNNFDVNSQGKVVKARKKKSQPCTDEENAMTIQWLEHSYRGVYGRAGSSHVAQDQNEA